MMRKKISLLKKERGDETLITNLLSWMQQTKADYTNTFCSLMKKDVLKDKLFQDSAFLNWHRHWQTRLIQNKKPIGLSLNLMRSTNPLIIPRNHKIEEALGAASISGNLVPMHNLLEVLKRPYDKLSGASAYQSPPEPSDQEYKTFCGT